MKEVKHLAKNLLMVQLYYHKKEPLEKEYKMKATLIDRNGNPSYYQQNTNYP